MKKTLFIAAALKQKRCLCNPLSRGILEYMFLFYGRLSMPIYEYECRDCHTRSSFLIMNPEREIPDLRCKKCSSPGLIRVVSRVNVLKSEEARMESLADPSKLSGLDENDPASVARWMKKLGSEMGEELGDDFEQEIDQAVEDAEAEKEASSGDDAAGSGDDL